MESERTSRCKYERLTLPTNSLAENIQRQISLFYPDATHDPYGLADEHAQVRSVQLQAGPLPTWNARISNATELYKRVA